MFGLVGCVSGDLTYSRAVYDYDSTDLSGKMGIEIQSDCYRKIQGFAKLDFTPLKKKQKKQAELLLQATSNVWAGLATMIIVPLVV